MATTEFDAGDNLSGQLTAAAVIRAADAVMKLPITLRLRNHRKRTIELRASTPCAVFRWQVVNPLGGTNLERETRFELATPTLARLCSTTELFPHYWPRGER